MTIKDKIRAIANERLPERLKLEFGCEVEIDTDNHRIQLTHKKTLFFLDENGWRYYGKEKDGELVQITPNQSDTEIKEFTILGKPVTLQEILWMLCYKENVDNVVEAVRLILDARYDWSEVVEEQSEDTLEAIYKLIK